MHISVDIPWWLPATIVTVIGLLFPARPGGSGGFMGGIEALFEYVVVFLVLAVVWIVTAFLK